MTSKTSLFGSFRRAFRGVAQVFSEERNFRIHVGATVGAFGAAWWLHVPTVSFLFLAFACAAVLLLELVNTVVERLADAMAPRLSYLVRDVKDMMAAAVLLAAILAIIVGVGVFAGPVAERVCDTLLICTAQTL